MTEGSDRDRSTDDEPPTSRLVRFGGVVAAGVIAASLAAIPSALRLSSAGIALGMSWLLLAGLSVVPSTVMVALLGRAIDGLRSLAGDAAAARAAGFAAWISMLLFFLVGFGALLRKKTHHHGLAGATYGVVALIFALAAALVATRFSGALAARGTGVQRAALAVMAASVLFGLIVLGSSVARTPGAETPLSLWVVDALAFGVAATLTSRTTFYRVRAVALVGPPLAVILLALAVSVVRSNVDARRVLHARAPAYALVGGPLVP